MTHGPPLGLTLDSRTTASRSSTTPNPRARSTVPRPPQAGHDASTFDVSAIEWILETRGVRTLERIPPGSLDAFCSALLIPLRMINDSTSEALRVAGYNLLHLLPAMVMGSCGRREPNARTINSIVKRRSAEFARGEWNSLLQEYRKNNPPGRSGDGRQGFTPGDDHEERALRRILNIAKKGLYSKAARRLLQPEIMTVDANVIEALRSKHPPRSAAIDPQEWSPRDLDSVDKLEFSWDLVLRGLQAAPGTSTPGLSGFRQEWLKAITYRNRPEEAELRTHITLLFQSIANGEVPRDSAALLNACQLIAVPKPSNPNDPRPIALGETFLKSTERIILQTVKPESAELWRQVNQWGSSIPGGVEAAAHAVRSLHLTDPTNITLSLDVRNAFNEVSRLSICRAVKKRFPTLLSYVKLILNDPSGLFILDSTTDNLTRIDSCEGVKQGFPLSGFLFCLVLYDVLLDIKARVPAFPAIAIADDLNLTGPPAEVYPAFVRFSEILAPQAGLTLQLHKVKAYTSGTWPAPPDGFTWRSATDPSTPNSILQSDGIRVGGIPIGSDEYVYAALRETTEESQALGTKIQALAKIDGGAQCAFNMVRFCLLPKVNHFARCIPPSDPSLQSCLRDHDDIVRETLQGIFPGVPLQELPIPQQISLPTRLGGLGLRSSTCVAPIAYVASWGLCGSLLRTLPALDTLIHSNQGPLHDTWEESMTTFTSLTGEPYVSLEETCASSTKGLQSKYSAVLEDSVSADLLDTNSPNLTPFHWARLHSLSTPGALDWLNAVPYTKEYELDNVTFTAALCLALGLAQPALRNIHTCAAGHRDVDQFGIHFMNRNCGGSTACTTNAGNWRQVRHDVVTRTLGRIIQNLGLRVQFEPRALPGMDANRRADLQVFGFPSPTQDAYLDLVIASPYASTLQLKVPPYSEVTAAVRAQQRKEEAYSRFVPDGAQFYPVAFDVFGSPAPVASDLLLDIARRTTERLHGSECGPAFERSLRVVTSKLRRQVSVVIQRENAKCILIGASRSPDAPRSSEHDQSENLLEPRPLDQILARRP